MANEAVSMSIEFLLTMMFSTILLIVLGRLANRLLHYFKECWSECQPNTQQFDDDPDDLDHRENPIKKTAMITRDKNNNTRTRKNYRQLAGLSDDDDDDEPDYVPMPSSKRVSLTKYLIDL